jgi:lipooligosaccharide transport system ATP-binding protein
MRMIHCASPVTAGELRVAGLDVRRDARRIKARLGVVPQHDNLDPDLTVVQNLVVYARFFDIPRRVATARADEALALFQLEEKREAKIHELSGGMKRRLVLARALVNQPEILILDEPTTGLDPQARHLVWQKLRLLRASGVTMLLTTHYMDEAAQLCDRLVIMDRGTFLTEGAPADLIRRCVGGMALEVRGPSEAIQRVGRDLEARRLHVQTVEDTIYVFSDQGSVLRDVEQGLDADEFTTLLRHSTLEDVFLTVAGRSLNE